MISTLNATKTLQDPHNRITRLSQCKLLPDTNPRTAVEGQIPESRPQRYLYIFSPA